MLPTTLKTHQIPQQIITKVDSPIKSIASITPVTVAADNNDIPYHFIQGKKYLGLVEGRLPNGNFSVLISNKLIQMHLPGTVQPGSTIELVLLSQHPKFKFALQHENTIRTASNSVISAVGKLLNILTQETRKTQLLNQPINTTSASPHVLLNSPKFPFFLQQTIHRSGLFYESHLAKWIEGKFSLSELQREPQSQLKTALPTTLNLTPDVAIDARSLQLVQQQLLALEKSYITWHGEMWNGQQIQWDIYKDTPKNCGKKYFITTQWKTKLTMTLPELGEIVIKLSLNVRDLQISIDTANNDTAFIFDLDQIALKQGMRNKGLTIQLLSIHHNDNSK